MRADEMVKLLTAHLKDQGPANAVSHLLDAMRGLLQEGTRCPDLKYWTDRLEFLYQDVQADLAAEAEDDEDEFDPQFVGEEGRLGPGPDWPAL